jgi:acyl-CoA synthetase (AMP-forming)/AMP-acid ligase II
MTSTSSTPTTLLGLIGSAPAERTAVIVPEQNIRVSYGSLRTQVQDVANQLAAAGIRPGDRVGMALPNGLPAIVSFLAASMAGTAAPLNPGYREDEFKFFLEDTNAKVLLLPPDGRPRRAAPPATRAILTVQMDAAGVVSLSNSAGNGKADPPDVDDVALILHTSGSTGRPKRRAAQPRESLDFLRQRRAFLRADAGRRLVVRDAVVSRARTGGVHACDTRHRRYGSRSGEIQSVVVLADGAGARRHVVLRGPDAASVAAGARGTWRVQTRRRRQASIHPLVQRVAAAAGHARSGGRVRRAGARGLRHDRSGASDVVQSAAARERRAGSVGCGTDVRISIMDSTGKHLGPNERGEVCISGPNVTKGYENNPEANASGFFGEWFRTGDQGFLDEKGYLTLVGRLKELINRGGEKISPREIDEVLLTHPAVAEAVCFGVPHPTWGEEVAAAVVLKPDAGTAPSAADLIAHCKGSLSAFKCPKQIHITDTIPRTATGKIQRRIVAEAFGQASNENRQSRARARLADTSARVSPRPARTLCCLPAVHTCGPCRHTACACRALKATSSSAAGHRRPQLNRQGRRRVSRRQSPRSHITRAGAPLRSSVRIPSSSVLRTAFRGGTSRATAASSMAGASNASILAASLPRRSSRGAWSDRSPTSRRTSSSRASSATTKAIASASASRTAPDPIVCAGLRKR